jgi:type VI secretion system protein ImpF
MGDLRSRDRLQPALLDRLLMDVPVIPSVLVRFSRKNLQVVGLDETAIVRRLTVAGLRASSHIANSASTDPDAGQLGFWTGPVETSLGALRALPIVTPTTEESVPLGSVCRISMQNVPDPHPESRIQSLIGQQKLREIVIGRDLPWLLNTPSLESWCDLSAYPEVRRSVLNFGIRALSGCVVEGLDLGQIKSQFEESLSAFEPRLRNVRVTFEPSPKGALKPYLVFRIEGDLWADPSPIPLVLRTQVALATDQVRVTEVGA